MDSDCKQGQAFGPSRAAAGVRKQKAPMMNDVTTPNKQRKIIEQSWPQNQSQFSTQRGPLTQGLGSEPYTLEQSTQIWIELQNQKNLLTETEFLGGQDQLAAANLKIEELENNLSKTKEINETMANRIQKDIKTRDEIIKKQNTCWQLMAIIQEHTDVIENTCRENEEQRKSLEDLYNKVILKQQDSWKNLSEHYNQGNLQLVPCTSFNLWKQSLVCLFYFYRWTKLCVIYLSLYFTVSAARKNLENDLIIKNDELSTIREDYEKLADVIKEKTQLMFEISSKRDECEKIIHENNEKYNQEKTELMNTIKQIEATLNMERESTSKLAEVNNENLEKYRLFSSKYKALEVSSAEYENQIKLLKSNILELKEKETSLQNELEELRTSHFIEIANKDLELAAHRKQLQDVTLLHAETIDKLDRETLCNQELSATLVKANEEVLELNNTIKNKNEQVEELEIELSGEIELNKKLSAEIQKLNEKLSVQEKEIAQVTANIEMYKAKEDTNDGKLSEARIELALVEQKLKDKCTETAKLLDKMDERKLNDAKEAVELKKHLKERSERIEELEKRIEILKKDISANKLEYEKKIQEARRSQKQCKIAGHEAEIREKNMKIDQLNQELSTEKLKFTRVNLESIEFHKNEKEKNEKHETQSKEMKHQYEELKKKISALRQENDNLKQKQLKDSNTSMEARNVQKSLSKMSSLSMLPSPTIPISKPILKLPNKDSPIKQHRVQFGNTSQQTVQNTEVERIFEEAERRIAQASRPDWQKMLHGTPTKSVNISEAFKRGSQTKKYKFFKSKTSKTGN
ncbi:putative autophagy-related protein 11 isoform X2 [Athalia rosae]|uniref:putative autophagy-related protein 11 isoform X2 n=1 Tax=Athalia rosae TaxID=37344 RepID=UPI002034A12B|nr:putative autophagy-related protein 11 isoform X2 [Athalia rosae]